MTAIPLRTERLILREFEDGDFAAVHDYARRPDVVRFMPWGPNLEADTRAFLQRTREARGQEPRKDYELAVALAEGGRLIGGAGLHVCREGTGCLGYCYHPDYWGRGLATEAAGALLRLGFETLGLHRIFATCDVENAASVRVMVKNGMRREAHFREDARLHGRWRDSYLYAILDREWRKGAG